MKKTLTSLCLAAAAALAWAGPPPAQPAAAQAVHTAIGVVRSVDAAQGDILVTHEPIPSLGWGKMTMVFKLQDPALAKGMKAGDRIRFEFHEAGGEYVIRRIDRR